MAFYADLSNARQFIRFLNVGVDTHSKIFFALSSVSLLVAIAVFLFGVDTMRGRALTSRPIKESWRKMADYAYSDCDEIYRDNFRVTAISQIEEAIVAHLENSHLIGLRLRKMSCGIILSICLAGATLLC